MMHVLAKLQETFDAEAKAYANLRLHLEREGLSEPPLLIGVALLATLVVIIAIGIAALPRTGLFA